MRYLLIILLSVIAIPAFAAPIDLGTPLYGQDGKPIIECTALNIERTKCEQETPMTVGFILRLALDTPEEKLPAIEIIKRGSLSERIKARDQMEFTVDEAKMLKDLLVKLPYRTQVKYQVIKIIDPKSVEDVK